MRHCRNNCETERRTQSSAFIMIEKAVGIIGGIGPMSTVYFMEMIINMTDAAKDQEHINMVVLNHATIPDRTSYILGESSQNPLAVMVEDAKKLQQAGADFIVIPCNTAHYFFEEIKKIADENGIACIAEGSNMDDNGDYRPGLKAVAELGIKSPLRESKMTKDDIRALSKMLGLPTWNKQSFACLSSRFVYGETINEEKLGMVDKAEQLLLDMGFHQVRVRIHGMMARIEIEPAEFDKLMKEENRFKIVQEFKKYGFTYVTLDLLGYRCGSMNETLKDEEKR